MTPPIQPTPLAPPGGLALTPALDRGVRLSADLRPAFLARQTAAEANLDRLFGDGALCVTTGQQPGLLTGNLLVIYKALSAVALAHRCEVAWGRPVVPVFWVAGDDHDFAEANHFFLLSQTNHVERVELRPRPPEADATPMYREAVGAEIERVLAQVRELTPETEFRDGMLERVAAEYRPDADIASAFAGTLADLLGRFGLVLFRPTHAAAKTAMTPYLLAALEHTADLNDAVRRRTRDLEEAGRPAPVNTQDDATLVMLEASQGRDRLLVDGDTFATRRSQETWTLEELRDIAANEPQRLSPNVLLRPVTEAALLPTVAYVAGPNEGAYLRQAAPVYDALGVPPQAVVTRWSGRIVENRIAKVLDKYSIEPDDLLGPEGQLEARLVSEGMPSAVSHSLDVLRLTIEAQYPKLLDAATTIDPTLRKPVESARLSALGGLADVEKRILSHLKQRDDVLVRQLSNARNALFPLQKPQERVFNVLQYLIRYGEAFLDGVGDACDSWAGSFGDRPDAGD